MTEGAGKKRKRVLVVDDEPKITAALSSLLEIQGYETLSAGNGEKALEIIVAERERKGLDAVVLDLVMPGMDGMEVLRRVRELWPQLPVIILSGHGTISRAVEATRLGAFDFLEKPIESEKIIISLENAIKKFRLEQERETLIQTALERFRMVGVSKAMQDIFQMIEKVAPTDTKVLITGESGTGKELIARAIHLRSERAAGPFMVVNCAAIPEELIESELFGHERGAFTGAIERKPGKFELAHKGTLFLDEVGDMSLRVQSKVLRAIENEEIQRVGGKQSIRVDARIICASNRDLGEAVRAGSFRLDLYYRLAVIKIHVPPLRERREDIPVLVNYFLRMFCEERKREPIRLSEGAMDLLMGYSWPGNVRELRNLMEKIVVLSRGETVGKEAVEQYLMESYGDAVRKGKMWDEDKEGEEGDKQSGKGKTWEALYEGEIEGEAKRQGAGEVLEGGESGEGGEVGEKGVKGASGSRDFSGKKLEEVREEAEREFILGRLRANNWNYEKTAEEIGVSRATLFNKIKRYGIRREKN